MFSVCFETACFGCFASVPKQRVSSVPKQTEDPPKQFKREYIWEFYRNLWLFRFVTKQICLFRLFQYRFETPKQTEIFSFWFHETNQNKRNRSCFCLFRFEPKFIFVCFEDTLLAWLYVVCNTEYIFLPEMKQGKCIWPLSWSVHCNFTGDGKCGERGWACPPTLTSLG